MRFLTRRLRPGLLIGTALCVWGAPALAQPAVDQLPDFDGAANGATVNTNAMTNTMTVTLQDSDDVIRWNSFSIGEDATVNFVTATDLVTQYTAVNRVLSNGNGANLSEIYGTLTAQDNIHLWLVNQDGITFGSSGVFSGASLLLSTLPFTGNDAQLLLELGTATPGVTFDRNGNSFRRINIQGGASLNSTTGNVVLLSERITLNGAITADNGDVVLVGAREVTFGDINSPLSFTILEGVRLNQNNSGITIAGDVTGNSVVAAAGGTGNLTRAILNINSNATLTATAVNGRVVLATATAATSGTDTATITNDAGTRANIVITGPGNGTAANAGETRTLVSEQGGISIVSDYNVFINGAALAADGLVAITATSDVGVQNTSIVTPGDVALQAGDDIDFNATTTSIGNNSTRAATVSLTAPGEIALGDVTATGIETSATPLFLTVNGLTAGDLDITNGIRISSTGDVSVASMTSQFGTVDVNANAANIIGGGNISTQGTVVLTANSIAVGSVVGGSLIDALATNAISFSSLASDSDIVVASTNGSITGGDVNPGNAAPTGAAFFSVGADDDLELGNVNATTLGSSVGVPLTADNITLGDVSTTNALDIVARDGDVDAGTLRTDGANIEVTATGTIDLDGALTTLGMGEPGAGSIGLYAGGDIGAGNAPQTLSAGNDVAVRSVGGDVTVGDVFAGDDIVLMAPVTGNGTVTFDSVTFLSPGTADSDHATFVLADDDFAVPAPGTASSVDFVAEGTFLGGALVSTEQTMGQRSCVPLIASCINLTGQRLAIAAQQQNIGDLNNVVGDQVFIGGDIVLPNNFDIDGNLIVQGVSVTLGQNSQTRSQQATGFVDIEATGGAIIFRGNLTLQSNSDGMGAEGITLTATGDIRPNANGNITLLGGSPLDPSAITVVLGGNFEADSITGLSLDLTDGINPFTQGNITIGEITTALALSLRSNSGNIQVDEAEVTGANLGIAIATGGSGNVTSDTSILTNGGDISISAGGNADLAQVSTSSIDPLNPVAGNVSITAGDEVILNNGLFAGGDVTITSTDLSGPSLAGDREDGLIVRDFSAGSADIDAATGDIRIGDLETTSGNLTVDALDGSVTGLAIGWTALNGGSIIDAVGTVTLAVTGTGEIGQLDAASVVGSGIDSLTIRELNVTSATLSAVNRLHIDSGSATTADLDTTGGSAAAFSQTGATPVASHGHANLSAATQLGVNAGGAAQLGTISAAGTGVAVSVTAETVQVLNASTSNALGNIEISATGGNLLIGTAQSAGTLLLDKDGTEGELRTSGDITSTGDLNLASESNMTANGALVSTSGNMSLTSVGDTTIFSALAASGTFTANSTANGVTGAEGSFDASLVRAQGNVTITADGTITADDDPASLAIPGFTQSIESTAGDVALNSGGLTELFSGSADGQFGVTAGAIDIGRLNAATINLAADAGGIALDEGDATGDILVNGTGAGDVVLTDLDTSGGNINVSSATSATVTTGNADVGSIDVMATDGDVNVNTLTTPGALGDVTLTASANVNAGSITGGGDLLADAGADATIVSTLMSGGVDVVAGDDIRIGSVSGAQVQLDAVDDISGLSDPGATGLVPDFGRGDANATLDISATAGGNVQLGTLDAGTSVTVAGAGVDLTTADAGTFVDIDASDGVLELGTGIAGTTIALTKLGPNDSLIAGSLSAPAGITANSSTSADVTSAISANGSVTVEATGDANLATGTANAGIVSVTSATGTASGGALTGDGVSVSGFGVDVTTANAGALGIDATANGGNLFVDTATSDTDITLIKTGDIAGDNTDGLTANSLTADDDIIVSSATFVDLGTSNAGNLLSIVSPETIEADDLESDGSIAINTGGDAVLGDIRSGRSIILLAAGDIGADSLIAVEDIAALAGGTIAIADFDAGDNVWLTAGTTLDLGGGSTSAGGADDATYVLDLSLAGDTAQTALAITDGPADAPDGDIVLAAPTDFALSGAISAAAADATIILRNLAGGSDTTSIGDSGGFAISEAELGLLAADNVVIDAGDQDIALGTFTIDSDTGRDTLRIITSGEITLGGAISGSGTGTLQIGQGEIGMDGLVDPASLTARIIATTENASVEFSNGVVDLRAVRIVFGNAAFVTLTNSISLDAAGELLADAASQLYIGDNSQRTFLQADRLRVAYSDFALFQNTAFSQGGGVILNADAANSVDDLALELFSQGDDGLDSFALFGEINGFIGRTAGVLPNSVLNIGTLNPRQLRVTQARSRVNGCVIGSPDRGCLIVDLPPPEITTIDERQTQRLISTDDPSAFLNPLVGRGNEGLILDIAQIPVGIDMLEQCDPEDEACQAQEGGQ
ncbi:filamentous hemagglutinin N-terminal domain-containing protein [Erythrobacter sp. EC-HK427]